MLNAIIRKIVPCLLVLLFFLGSKLIFDISEYLIVDRRYGAGITLFASSAILLMILAWTFVHIVSLPDDHAAAPRDPPQDFQHPIEVDANGQILRCFQGKCRGSWKPPRSRHCKTHGRCSVAWDHCCPCVSLSSRSAELS